MVCCIVFFLQGVPAKMVQDTRKEQKVLQFGTIYCRYFEALVMSLIFVAELCELGCWPHVFAVAL